MISTLLICYMFVCDVLYNIVFCKYCSVNSAQDLHCKCRIWSLAPVNLPLCVRADGKSVELNHCFFPCIQLPFFLMLESDCRGGQ